MSKTPSPGELPLVTRARLHGRRKALESPEGKATTYAELLRRSEAVARRLLGDALDLEEARIAFLLPPGPEWVAVQWGIWRAGGIAVPMALSHPPPELAYVLDDAGASAAVAVPETADRLAPLARERDLPLLDAREIGPPPEPVGSGDVPALPGIATGRRAMMLYTSGTTARPKGVVTTHGNLEAQMTSLVQAWEWSADDRIPLFLPLHHVHGIVNVLGCALWAGARCRTLPGFDADTVWKAVSDGDFTLFMAVPTIYGRLLSAWDEASAEARESFARACTRMRLMVSGSAALPVSVLERWKEITGHVLLERYGMTEVGMALSNPLRGERRPGFVGTPLPGVQVRLLGENGEEASPGTPGEIHLRGAGIFLEYWRRPDETDGAFRSGWFATGDLAVLEDGSHRILGRQSVDIIKTGGYKVSALEVEEVLRRHPGIRECAVVGVPDSDWGERVAVAVVFRDESSESPAEIRDWAKERLAPYKTPSSFLTLPRLPRNAMGKVTKPRLRELFTDGVRDRESGPS